MHVLQCRTEQRPLPGERPVAGVTLDEVLDLRGEARHRAELVPVHLAEEQVVALDGGRALVQSVDLGVADVLLQRVVLQVTRPAVHLQRLGE